MAFWMASCALIVKLLNVIVLFFYPVMPIAWVMPGCPARAFSGIPDALTFRFPNPLVALGLRLHRSGRPPQRIGGKIHSSKSLPIPLSGFFAVSHASLAENLTVKPVKMTCFQGFMIKIPFVSCQNVVVFWERGRVRVVCAVSGSPILFSRFIPFSYFSR